VLLVPSAILEAASLTLWAVIVTIVLPLVVTGEVVTWNVCWLLPAPTSTDGGTVTMALFALSGITLPSSAAGPLKVTVAVALLPETTVEGFNTSDVTTGADIKIDPML